MVDEKGAEVILKNKTPGYVIIDYSKLQEEIKNDDILVQETAKEYLTKHIKAFKELAK